MRAGGARLPPFHYLPIPQRSRVRRSFSFSFETGENVSDSHFAYEPKKEDLSEFMKLNFSVFVRNGGTCERFAFRFVPKKNVSETGATYFDLPP